MTKRECAIVMAYTGYCMLTGNNIGVFYKYVEEKIGRPFFTHELLALEQEIKRASEDDFIALCKNATEDN
jgi:hypothetical protein